MFALIYCLHVILEAVLFCWLVGSLLNSTYTLIGSFHSVVHVDEKYISYSEGYIKQCAKSHKITVHLGIVVHTLEPKIVLKVSCLHEIQYMDLLIESPALATNG